MREIFCRRFTQRNADEEKSAFLVVVNVLIPGERATCQHGEKLDNEQVSVIRGLASPIGELTPLDSYDPGKSRMNWFMVAVPVESR